MKPDEVRIGFGSEEFDPEGRYVEARFRQAFRDFGVLPSGSSGDERQQAKFRFMDVFMPHLAALSKEREVDPVRRREHRAQGNRHQELEEQPEELRLACRKNAPG